MKKWIVRIALILIFLILISIIYGWIWKKNMTPDYEEKITGLETISDVDIYYDQYAIPHIYATNNSDAYKALGYVHAKDRLWQMDLFRRIAPGFCRSIGLAHQSAMEAKIFSQSASTELKEIVEGYLTGVNHYIDTHGKTIEHTLLGVDIAEFTIEDIYNTMGYMAFSFAVAHKTEPIVDHIYTKYGQDYLNDLDLHIDSATTSINSSRTAFTDFYQHLN